MSSRVRDTLVLWFVVYPLLIAGIVLVLPAEGVTSWTWVNLFLQGVFFCSGFLMGDLRRDIVDADMAFRNALERYGN